MTEWLGLPPLATTHGGQVDSLIGWVHIFMFVLFIGWGAFFTYTLIRFRRSRNPVAHYSGAKKLGHGARYKYSHDEPFGIAEQQYAPDVVADAEYYKPTSLGAEAAIKERWERVRRLIRGR